MDFEKELNEFQVKRIKDRLNFDFTKELKKNNEEKDNFYKKFKIHLDIFNTELYNSGVLFYSFTIKTPFLDQSDPNFWYYTHLQIEKWVNEFRDKIELIEFCYISIELCEKKNIILNNKYETDVTSLFHGIIGVRSLIGNNKNHFNEIKKFFNLDYYDIRVKNLCSLKSIKDYWIFLIKQKNFKFHRFCQYSRFFESLYGGIADLELQYDEDHSAFDLDLDLNSKYVAIEGIKYRNPDKVTILNYLLTLYMYNNNYYLNDNNLYKKNINSRYSWEIIGKIDYLQFNNINIINELKLMFPQQLDKLNTSKLFNEAWDFFYKNINMNNHYLPTISFEKDIIEFKNGIYLIKNNEFLSFKLDNNNINIIMNNKNSLIFINKDYESINLPKKWLKSIQNKSYCLETYCFFLAKTFNEVLTKNTNQIPLIKILFKKKDSVSNEIINTFLEEENISDEELVEIILYCNKLYFLIKD